MAKFIRSRCRNCMCYRPSLEYRESNYCSMGLCSDSIKIFNTIKRKIKSDKNS